MTKYNERIKYNESKMPYNGRRPVPPTPTQRGGSGGGSSHTIKILDDKEIVLLYTLLEMDEDWY